MAYDRYDRDQQSRWQDDRADRAWRDDDHRVRSDRGEDRGFFERAGDEIASWFGGPDSDHRGRERERDLGSWRSRDERSDRDHDRGYGRDYDRDRSAYSDRHRRSDRDFNEDRGVFSRGGSSDSDYNRGWARNLWGSGEARSPREDRHRQRIPSDDRYPGRSHRDEHRESSDRYRPMAGDYGRGSRDDHRQPSFGGAGRNERGYDPNYRDWRDRHMSEVDRDYHDYRRENQSRFEDDFAGWRGKRQEKRGLLGQIREHMEVVGQDREHVGTVDKVAGDRIILAKSDPQSGGAHHSITCAMIDRVEGNRVVLDCPARDARNRWRDEDRSRALFERPDRGEDGPGVLNRSFSGTYRDR